MKREPELAGLAANHQQDNLESTPWQPWALMNLQAVTTLARVLCEPRRTSPSSSQTTSESSITVPGVLLGLWSQEGFLT